MLDHEAREFFAVDQDDALRALLHIILGGARETGGGDEHALGRARRIDRAGKVAEIVFAHGVAGGVFLGLNINLVQAECVLLDRAVDPAVARASGHPAHRGIATAIAHGDQQIDNHLFGKDGGASRTRTRI